MAKTPAKLIRRRRARTGIRKRVQGTPERPRLSVYRSSKHIYAQVIDDLSGKTIAAANTVQLGLKNGANMEGAKQVGQKVAEEAKAAGVTEVAFDRGGFRYHGRIQAIADAAREGGLQF